MRAPTAGEGSVLVLRSGGWRGEVGGGCVICGFLEKMYVDKRVDIEEAIGFPTICVILCVCFVSGIWQAWPSFGTTSASCTRRHLWPSMREAVGSCTKSFNTLPESD